MGAREEGDPLLEGWESKSLSILLACCPLKGTTGIFFRLWGLRQTTTPCHTDHGGQRTLTAAGPVAGSPRVMLGKDGDVYRGSGATEPSRVTSLCAKLVCRQKTS